MVHKNIPLRKYKYDGSLKNLWQYSKLGPNLYLFCNSLLLRGIIRALSLISPMHPLPYSKIAKSIKNAAVNHCCVEKSTIKTLIVFQFTLYADAA